MSNARLRHEILAFMGSRVGSCPTWWFKGYMPYRTPAIRKELELMEREGLVTSDRRQSNNTKWEMAGGLTH